VLRAARLLAEKGYSDIKLLKRSAADILCLYDGTQTCVEVKTLIADRNTLRKPGQWLEDEVAEKMKDILPKARTQLSKAKSELFCKNAILIVVINWVE
jgi:hypothetical protein